jgi:class 3 adenylate cyclase/tetratricopeptide (TPR) repeat protein
METPVVAPSAQLQPYIPRLLIQWLADARGTILRTIDGTVVFVDISGFTAMSERLAKKGKVGAEEVTDVLGGIFARLLSVAYGEGGGLIKFGGDALLLWFEGPNHTLRGARAAHGMRRTLRSIGRIETSAGKIGLRMSVGVHSGEFHFFLVGDSHRELIVTGPAATRTVDMEGTAEAGEVLVSPEAAAYLDPRALGATKGPGVLLVRDPKGPIVDRADVEIPIEAIDVESCVPLAIREHLLVGASEPEHRQATVAFVHFDGVDEMVETDGPEAVAFGLEVLVGSVQLAADKHGVTFLGSDIDHDGGKLILAAGVPYALGDDEERMLLTLRSIIETDSPIPIRIGTNRGHVFAGDVGPPYRRTYTVMGDAVNLAARVMSKAVPGQLLATDSVLDASPVAFRTEALEPFMVKGKAKPVVAYDVGPIEGTKGGSRPDDDVPFVGRDREIAQIDDALEAGREGHGRLLEIFGPPGIGKTRLLGELVARADGFRVLQASCELYEAATAYRPFRSILRSAVDMGSGADDEQAAEVLRERVEAVAPDLLPWLPLIAIPFDVDMPSTTEVDELDEEFRRDRLHEVVGDLLGRLMGGMPMIVAFEDVHWMDEASSELLAYLAAGVTRGPWVIAVTRRSDAGGFVAAPGDHARRLALRPLTRNESERLIALVTEDAPLSPHDIDVLVERSGGNPLFLRELIGAARSADSLEDLPTSIEGIVTTQIDRLRGSDLKVLRYAAVLGPRFQEELVADLLAAPVAMDPGTWRRLDDLVESDGSGWRRFRHALIRDVAYAGLPFKRRKELHARAGAVIAAQAGDDVEDSAEILSEHFFHAGWHEESFRYSRLAGEAARAKFAHADAARFLERSLRAADRLGVPAQEIAEVNREIGDAYWRLGRYDEAAAAYRRTRKLLGQRPIEVSELLLKESAICERRGRYSQALRWAARARSVLEGMSGPEVARQHARATMEYASLLQFQGRHKDAIDWSATALREAQAVGEREVVAQANLILGYAHLEMGSSDADMFYELALQGFAELEDVSGQALVLSNMGVTAYYAGRWDDAVELWERSAAMRERLGDMINAAYGIMNIGEVDADQGRLDEAEERFRRARRIWRAADHQAPIAYVTMNLGRTLCRAGKLEEGVETLRDARAQIGALGAQGLEVEVDLRLAEGLLLAGRGDEALDLIDTLSRAAEVERGEVVQAALSWRLRGYALLQIGSADEARAAFLESVTSAREMEQPFELALSLTALIDVAHLEGATADPLIENERRAILTKLGVETLPEVPLVAVTSGASVV